ncbi:hypothetical protein E1B28_012264 [Marasmius oreades]|uniref:Uncharacterized protein n=1 Tax=Marasmius oreades TaxID=181124 RepID=A0A9P7UNR8_9AGAR|nr:uncharacterized protein E1B28_012264 [Marasmius oreades]KAG7088250.1 hypothetical protein E1B28_012264 [Marasmius oreades]
MSMASYDWEPTKGEWRELSSRYLGKAIDKEATFTLPGSGQQIHRPCFETLYDLILRRFFEDQPVVLTGNPGLGKSVALFSVLLQLLSEKPTEDVIFIYYETGFFFRGEEVYRAAASAIEGLPPPVETLGSPPIVLVRGHECYARYADS